MKKVSRYILLASSMFLLGLNSVSGQIFDPSCKDKVWKYYKQGYANIQKPIGNKVYYYNILFESVSGRESKAYPESVDIKIYLSENQIYYISKTASVYQDNKDAFMLVNNPRVLIRARSEQTDKSDNLMNMMELFADSVFITSKVIDCVSATNSEKDKLLIVTLQTSKKAMEALNVERIVYQLNETKKRIDKTTMFYVEAYKYKKTVFTYKTTDFNHKKKMNFPVKNIFLDANGAVLKKYSLYRYIDNR